LQTPVEAMFGIILQSLSAFCLLLLPALLRSASAETIKLDFQGGVYTVPVRINDAFTLGFVLDSGASDTSIPADVLLTLFRTRTIAATDFIGTRTYVLADGSRVPGDRFIVRELKIGDHVLKNVQVSIGSVKGEPLLGQSFLSRLPSYTIDNRQKALVIGEGDGTDPTQTSNVPPDQSSPPALVNAQPRSVMLCGHEVDFALHHNESPLQQGYLGAWAGVWNNTSHICGGMIVEGGDDEGDVDLIYIYGPSALSSQFPWKQQKISGTIDEGGILTFRDEQGSQFRFSLSGKDRLDGIFAGKSGNLSSRFARVIQ
jgi:hypothetical protein